MRFKVYSLMKPHWALCVLRKELSKIRGSFLVDPHNEEYSMLGSVFGDPHF